MINLLPLSEQKRIRNNYIFRVAALALFFVTALGMLSTLLLLSSYILVRLKETDVVERLAFSTEAAKERGDFDLIQSLKAASAKNKILKENKPGIITLAVEAVTRAADEPGIHLKSIKTIFASGKGTIRVDGIADSRDGLVNLVNRLKADTRFSSVDLPISNLAKDKDITFAVTLEMPV